MRKIRKKTTKNHRMLYDCNDHKYYMKKGEPKINHKINFNKQQNKNICIENSENEMMKEKNTED